MENEIGEAFVHVTLAGDRRLIELYISRIKRIVKSANKNKKFYASIAESDYETMSFEEFKENYLDSY